MKTSHVISSREGHAQNLCHKGTTGVIFYQVLQDESLLKIEFFGKTYATSWLSMSIPKDWSTHSEFLTLQACFSWNIFLKHDCIFHNADKDGDQNIDLPYD